MSILHLENTELQEFDGSYTEYNYALLEKKIELQEIAAEEQAEIAHYKEEIVSLKQQLKQQLQIHKILIPNKDMDFLGLPSFFYQILRRLYIVGSVV